MQKKLIALAVAGLVSGGAFAQTNVTIYGVADLSFDSAKAEGGSNNATGTLVSINQPSYTRVNSNSSYIGFKGTEDLGNGLKAMFQMENQVAMDNGGGANAFANRDTFLALSGNFGTVSMGNQTGPYRGALAAFEVTPGATSSAAGVMNIAGRALTAVGATSSAAGVNLAPGGLLNTQNRLANVIMYVSPSFSGFQGAAGYSANPAAAFEFNTPTPTPGAGQATINPTAYTFGLSYDNGPLKVRSAYQKIKEFGATFGLDYTANAMGDVTVAANNRALNSDIESWIIGAGYTFGGATTVNIAYDQNETKTTDGQVGGAAVPALAAGATRINQAKMKTWILSAKHVMGPHEFSGSYAKAKASLSTSTGITALGINGLEDQGADQWTLRYGYNMSKRTQAYVYYTQVSNDRNGVYNFMTNPAAGTAATGGTGANGQEPTAFGVGMRHSF